MRFFIVTLECKHFILISCYICLFVQPSGKTRRPIRTSLPLDRDSVAEVSQKLKSAVIDPSDGETRNSHSPCSPKRMSPSSTPAAPPELIRHNSAGPLPTPPSSPKHVINTRRVRSGPKERSSSLVNSHVKSSPTERVEPSERARDGKIDPSLPCSAESAKRCERTGSGDERKKKSRLDGEKTSKDDLVLYYEDRVKPLLGHMEEKFAERNLKDLCQDCLKLWNALEKKGLIGKASGGFSARRRGEVLRTVFKFLDLNDPRLLLRLGRLILSVSFNVSCSVLIKGIVMCIFVPSEPLKASSIENPLL